MDQEPLSKLELIKNGAIKGREALQWLAEQEEYVYHGSSLKLERLEPRQQQTWDYDNLVSASDGDPAVCAGNTFEPAIFRALVNREFDLSDSHWSGWSDNGETIRYRATETALEGAKQDGVVGYVHVFKKQDFLPWKGMEYRTGQEIVPELVAEVTAKDLPENIKIVEPYKQ